ncbi:hypothetical protein HDU76_001457 [Blyttiomyces sp. JEL0837]|nr:hypothetical protein HDU76_001457 [Blyttiomyces sp. JEL0837]
METTGLTSVVPWETSLNTRTTTITINGSAGTELLTTVENASGTDYASTWFEVMALPFTCTINIVSILASIATIAGLLIGKRANPIMFAAFSDRFRIILLIIIANIIYHVSWIYSIVTSDSVNCAISIFMLQTSQLSACFLTFTLVINIFIVTVLEKVPWARSFELYLFISIGTAIALSLPPQFMGVIGFDANEAITNELFLIAAPQVN